MLKILKIDSEKSWGTSNNFDFFLMYYSVNPVYWKQGFYYLLRSKNI